MIHELTTTPLRLSVDWASDHLLALAYGPVVDGKPEDEYMRLSDAAALILAEPNGDLIGFVVDDILDLDSAEAVPELWEGPRFDVPELGLRDATAGEITAAGLAIYSEESTLEAQLFHEAIAHQDEDDIELRWRLCLGAGDLKAHFGLGYTLCELDRCREAYGHLRYYTELTPRNAWAWCWLGHACRGTGEREEAVAAYERALELERNGGFKTDADECLRELAS